MTTSHKPGPLQAAEARELADRLNVRYVSRRHLAPRSGESVIVVENDGLYALKDGKRFFFHPSLAVIRKSNIDCGQEDYLMESLSLRGDERVLDCTLGLGSEALLMANFLPEGKVIGLENSRVIRIIVEEGMKPGDRFPKWVNAAIPRIEIVEADYKKFVRTTDQKFDCVYADPMFEHPKYASSAMNSMRPFTDNSLIDPEDIEAMKRIATSRVVVKARWNDSIFERYGFDQVKGSLKSGIGYGVVKV